MPYDDHKELFGNFFAGKMCPVINEMTDWERREALGGDRYGYYGTLIVDPVPPITMTHRITASGVIGVMWKMTKDIVTPFWTDMGEGIVTSWCASAMVADAAVVAVVMCSEGKITGLRRARPF